MHYRSWNNYRRGTRKKKYEDISRKNENIMSAERQLKLLELREKYKDGIKKPLLEDFNLNEELVKEITALNEEVESRNQKIRNESNSKKERREKILSRVHGVAFWSTAITIFILALQVKEKDIAPLLGFWGSVLGGVLVGGITRTIVDAMWPIEKEKKLFPKHEKSEDLDEYSEKVSLFNLFNELLNEEKIDKEERSKRDFWLSLNGFEFEDQITGLFSKLGYKANKTKNTGDGGVDVVLIDKRGSKILVQCKAHKKPVGPHIVRDLFGVMQSEKADRGILINLGGFTQGVIDFANGKKITLLDLFGVLDLQKRITENAFN